MFFISLLQVDIYAGSVFLYEAVGWNVYLSAACILAITAVYTVLGNYNSTGIQLVVNRSLCHVGTLNGPFAADDHMECTHVAWRARCETGHSKQSDLDHSNFTFVSFECPSPWLSLHYGGFCTM